MEGVGCDALEDLAISVNSGPFGSNLLKSLYVDDGVIVLRPFNIEGATIRDDDLVYISEKTRRAQGLPIYEPESVAFARVGDIRCGIIPDFGKPVTISPNIIVAKLNAEKVNPFYLAVFMNTWLGFSQLQRAMKVVAQPTITVETVKSLLIPRIPKGEQSKIESILRASLGKRRESKDLYAEAETLLLAELGLDELDLSHKTTYVQSFEYASASGRLDAEFFQPRHEQLETAVQAGEFSSCTLGDLIEPIRNGYDYRDFTDEGTPYVRVGDIKAGRIDIDGAFRVPISIRDVEKDVGLQPGDILFTRKGSFGNAAVVRHGQEHAIISSEIMLLRLKDSRVRPDYIALFLNSPAGFQQVERRVHGVAFYSISQSDLAEINIPIASLDIQLQLAELVAQSLESEQEAKDLLQEAKHRVEEMVLEGEV